MANMGEMVSGEGQKKLLAIVDQFRQHNLSQDISLPQLVVVGDQSSGKSSLLQALTELPFPIASELCTRHATQVLFSRSTDDKERITVSIIPSDGSDTDHRAKLEEFSHTVDNLVEETFTKILNEASKAMGLPDPHESTRNLTKRFSDDVLKIELCGPKNPHLSFIDIPGIFHNPTEHQTDEDAVLIRSLIETYIREPRTIIMAVMNATQNLANQEIFKSAKLADPNGHRTVGVITKIDCVQEGDEAGVIKHAKNEVTKLQHGWFCVRNRSTAELLKGVTLDQRREMERLVFEKNPWNELDRERCGVPALKSFLERMLTKHLRGEFPGLKKQIGNLLAQSLKELESLGPPRTTAADQRSVLVSLATEYQNRIDDSLLGRLSVDSSSDSKLRTWICNLSQSFSHKIAVKGRTLNWRSTDESTKEQEPWDLPDDICPKSDFGVFADDDGTQLPDLYDMIRTQYRTSRGTELPGLVNPSVLESLFRYQSLNWNEISKSHVAAIQDRISKCHKEHLKTIIVDVQLRDRLFGLLQPEFDRRLEIGPVELTKILEDERHGILQTTNHYYADNLAKARAARVIAQLKSMGYVNGKEYKMDFKSLSRVASRSNEVSAVHDIHDILCAYYKVAMKRFCDTVASQVVERNLVGKHGPLRVFNPTWVAEWNDETLRGVAEENWNLLSRREGLRARVERLEKALEVSRDV